MPRSQELPPCLPGFEHINRYWDRPLALPAAKIMPGELYVSTRGELVSTVLGSCISACIRDSVKGIGGMNHFMLPMQTEHSSDWGSCNISAASRYGNWAMEYLINEILKNGGSRGNLEAKLFGGGSVLKNMDSNVGEKNIQFARDYLFREGIPIVAEDVGCITPRKVLYFTDTGAVKMKRLRSTSNETISEREESYVKTINNPPADTGGDIELF